MERYDLFSLLIFQRRCLLEQQEALQTFGNRMPETPPDIVEVEKIVIDDDKYDSGKIPLFVKLQIYLFHGISSRSSICKPS